MDGRLGLHSEFHKSTEVPKFIDFSSSHQVLRFLPRAAPRVSVFPIEHGAASLSRRVLAPPLPPHRRIRSCARILSRNLPFLAVKFSARVGLSFSAWFWFLDHSASR